MIRLVLVGALLAACGNKGSNDGLPPATDWNTDEPGMATPPPATGAKQDPHEGVPGAPDLADEEQVPSEDVEEQPIDVTSDQPIDPAYRVRGTLKLAKALAARVKPDGVIFLMAKLAGPDGKPTGTAMAVDRTNWKADGQAFELGGATGEVLVIARYDQDQDGSTTEPGDVIGMTRVKVPADNVVIELSTLVP